jgi:hypothetical protein
VDDDDDDGPRSSSAKRRNMFRRKEDKAEFLRKLAQPRPLYKPEIAPAQPVW